jgi:hypothetical protein
MTDTTINATVATCPADYKHIRALGQALASLSWYIAEQQAQAFEQGAPIDATFEICDSSDPSHYLNPTGRWATVDSLRPELRDRINKMVEEMSQEK